MTKETMGSAPDDSGAPVVDGEEAADGLEQRADAIRNRLRQLVGELDARRLELGRKMGGALIIGAAVAGVGLLGALVWRGVRSRQSGRRVGGALKRLVAVPSKHEARPQSLTRRLVGVAAEAAVAVASRELAKRYLTSGKRNAE